MKSRATRRFWSCFESFLPSIQTLARKNYLLWLKNSHHPSLHFKKLSGSETRFSIRVGDRYRAVGQTTGDGVEWVWIGSHEEYNKLLNR